MRANEIADCDDEASWDEAPAAPVPVLNLPELEVDIDRIHYTKGGDRFDVELDGDGRLHITSGSVTLPLPPHHTRRLMLWLLDCLQRAGGAQ